MDFALLYDGERCYCGWGSSASHAEQREKSFYINTFSLEDPRPWKSFERFGVTDDVPDTIYQTLVTARSWNLPRKSEFAKLWEGATNGFRDAVLQKIVLAVTDSTTDVEKLTARPSFGNKKGYFYAFSLGGHSAWGFSPELLFEVTGRNSFETMALAGTFASDSAARPASLAPEHAIVVDYFRDFAAKNQCEMISAREETLEQAKLSHILTRVEFRKISLDSIATTLADFHPTPALGVYPKNSATMKILVDLRKELPPHYGAPYGFYSMERSFFVVMIRGFFYDGKVLRRPFGVGVTPYSNFDSEWEELQLKRRSVEAVWNP